MYNPNILFYIIIAWFYEIAIEQLFIDAFLTIVLDIFIETDKRRLSAIMEKDLLLLQLSSIIKRYEYVK